MTKPHVFPGPCKCQKCCRSMPGYRGFKAAVNRERAETTVRTSQTAEQGPTLYATNATNNILTPEVTRPSACEHPELVDDVFTTIVIREGGWRCNTCAKKFVFLPTDVVGEVRAALELAEDRLLIAGRTGAMRRCCEARALLLAETAD